MQCSTDIQLLRTPIIQALAYYDLFEYPLTAKEIYTFLPFGGCSEYELSQALAESVVDGALRTSDGFYYLSTRDRSIARRRLEMEENGRRMWRIARLVAGMMRHAPFVRGIFISGQLCRYIASEESDVDYFIVTEPGRLWIVRTLFVFVRRTLLLNRRKYFCTNYYVTTSNLKIRERNPYAACEVASLKPIFNRDLFDRFMQENGWISEFYPNYSTERIEFREGVEGRSLLQRAIEALFPKRLASRLDARFMETTRNFWRKKFPDGTAEMYEVSLRTHRNESRAHPHDRAPLVLDLYRENLRRHGALHD